MLRREDGSAIEHDEWVPGRVPRLSGLGWNEVAPYLEEFLKRLMEANDGTQERLTELVGSSDGAGADPLRRAVANPHNHIAHEVLGLEPAFAPRPPRTHTHGTQDIVGLDQAGGIRRVIPHTHGAQDILGVDPGGGIQRPTPHTHAHPDLIGLVGDRDLILASQVFGG
jgi:hypothetical protein